MSSNLGTITIPLDAAQREGVILALHEVLAGSWTLDTDEDALVRGLLELVETLPEPDGDAPARLTFAVEAAELLAAAVANGATCGLFEGGEDPQTMADVVASIVRALVAVIRARPACEPRADVGPAICGAVPPGILPADPQAPLVACGRRPGHLEHGLRHAHPSINPSGAPVEWGEAKGDATDAT